MFKMLLIIMLSISAYSEIVELSKFKLSETRIFDASLDTIKFVRDNQRSVAQYSSRTEYFTVSEVPKITMCTRLSDKSDGSISIYFDSTVNFKANEKVMYLYLNDGKIWVDEDSLLIRDFKNYEPIVFDMLLKYRKHLSDIKTKFENEENAILNSIRLK